MKKFLAVVKREYVQRVRTKFFVVATVVGPLMMACFTVIPGLLMVMKTGGPTRLAIVDQTGKMYERVSKELVAPEGRESELAGPSTTGPAAIRQNPKDRIDQAGKLI